MSTELERARRFNTLLELIQESIEMHSARLISFCRGMGLLKESFREPDWETFVNFVKVSHASVAKDIERLVREDERRLRVEDKHE